MVKRYKVIGGSRLSFPNGQEVGPGEEFERDYDPEMEMQHLMGGHIQAIPETKPARSRKRVEIDPSSVTEEGDDG